MDEIFFEVQGSALEPYRVDFIKRSTTNLSAYCSCPAGKNGLYCKHRFAIMRGEQENIVSSNASDVKTIQSWLTGTDIEKNLLRVSDLEKEAEKIKNELASAKKSLAKAMSN